MRLRQILNQCKKIKNCDQGCVAIRPFPIALVAIEIHPNRQWANSRAHRHQRSFTLIHRMSSQNLTIRNANHNLHRVVLIMNSQLHWELSIFWRRRVIWGILATLHHHHAVLVPTQRVHVPHAENIWLQHRCQHMFTFQGQQSAGTHFHSVVARKQSPRWGVHLPNLNPLVYTHTHTGMPPCAIVYRIGTSGCSTAFPHQCTFSFGKPGWLHTEWELMKKTVPFNSFLLNGQQEKCN